MGLLCVTAEAARAYVAHSCVYLTMTCHAAARLAQNSPSLCAVAAWRAAMWHLNYSLDDDLVLCVLHVHRVSFVSNNRCFSSISHPQSPVHLAHHASMTAAIFRGRLTPTKWATDNPPTTGTIVRKVARSRVTLLQILPILGPYNRRPLRGRHVACPIEILRIVLLHC